MEFYIFDLNLERKGIVDDFIEVELNSKYDDLGKLHLIVDGTKENVELLQVDRIITKATDITKGYIIKTRDYRDNQSTELEIIAPSINKILNDRLVLGQQEYTGTIENVMKSFVNANAVNPANPNRIIPNLEISENRGIPFEVKEGTVNKPLCDYLYEIAKKNDVSFDILLDHTNKKFVFDVWQGEDRSALQSENPHVIFSKEFENVLTQNYVDDINGYKSTAIVLGEEIEGQTQEIVTVNDDNVGFERKEILVESTNLKRTYRDENGVERTQTEEEYRKLLEENGRNTLAEYQPTKTLESNVDPLSNFIYGVDYFMGDKVSVRDDDLGIILHTRIISVVEKGDKQGNKLQVNFGSNIPDLLTRIKKVVNN
ncbi:siphovirus ReqiPepy6 Gp37-like family protein [Robertmurraya siralis]|uniref:siphovirus ReqiPepy6 Gp37-like family protein n=1 Tax=Robertmurraya siralis TaxID=77777 RepID=UPI0014770623|nr:siphovirus ReqiPepy6 Gp37-like family protein [Robertmurraya siralis]